MLNKTFAEVRAFGSVGPLVLALIVCSIVLCSIAEAQSSDTSATVLRFKIPPAQPSPPPPSTVPSAVPQGSATESPPAVIDEKPEASIQPPDSAPSELDHEVLTPQTDQKGETAPTTPSPTPPADSTLQPKAEQKTSSVEQPPSAAKPDKKGTEAEKSAKMLLSLDVQKNDSAGDVLKVTLNGFYPPQVSPAEGPSPRIICDFLDMALGKGIPKILPVNGKYISRVRVGLHTQPIKKVRIVLDLVPENNYEVEQIFYQQENLYTILVKKRP